MPVSAEARAAVIEASGGIARPNCYGQYDTQVQWDSDCYLCPYLIDCEGGVDLDDEDVNDAS